MKALILQGSLRPDGNTAALVKPFRRRMEALGSDCTELFLNNMKLRSCIACRCCQDNREQFGCIHDDDMQQIFDLVLESDVMILATPIYSWYCTPPLKTVLDRLVYGMNKYYGKESASSVKSTRKEKISLWKGKQVALITTCGYPLDRATELWEEGIKRYCKHSQLQYIGMLAERFMGYDTVFMDAEKEKHAEEFADIICGI